MAWYRQWRPYVPVHKRRAKAAQYAAKLAKGEKRTLCPVTINGRLIAKSFWGRAWCDNLEHYSDYENRLPRGRTYARNGSIIDLQIERGKVRAIVSGSDIYRVTIDIDTLKPALWKNIKRDCSQSIDSLMDLLMGRFDQGVMQRLTRPDDGLFPQFDEIHLKCSCPDWAVLCKHAAAVMYGIGARLDAAPDLLFTLRDVDHLTLVNQAVTKENLDRSLNVGQDNALAGSDLGELFGIDLETAGVQPEDPRGSKSEKRNKLPKKSSRLKKPKQGKRSSASTSRGKTADKSLPKSSVELLITKSKRAKIVKPRAKKQLAESVPTGNGSATQDSTAVPRRRKRIAR